MAVVDGHSLSRATVAAHLKLLNALVVAKLDNSIQVTKTRHVEEIGKDAWNDLWRRSEVPTIFARYEWAHAWSISLGKSGDIRTYAAWVDGRLVGLLPTVWPGPEAARRSPVRLVGDYQADYAAILTESGVQGTLSALLEKVSGDLASTGRLILSDVRSDSPHARQLNHSVSGAMARWRLTQRVTCPRTSLTPARTQQLANKDSLRRHARQLAKLGTVEVHHFDREADILPRLDPFFLQHIARWATTGSPSLFHDESAREFYRCMVSEFSDSGQLIFTEVLLNGVAVASHFGFISEGDLIWYKPTFDPALSRIAPGEVLLRELLILAGSRELTGFDFTRGDESFKMRFADDTRSADTYVFYANSCMAFAARGMGALRVAVKKALPHSMLSMIRSWVRRSGL